MAGMTLKAIRDLKVSEGVNIKDVKVPERLKERTTTGIAFLDDAFGGQGIAPSTVAVLTGDPGAGKTTLMLQVCDSLKGKGHEPVLNSREESVEQISIVAERLQLKHGFGVGQERRIPDLIEQMKELHKKSQARADLALKKWQELEAAVRAQNPTLSAEQILDLTGPQPSGKAPQQVLVVDSLQSHDDGKYKDGGINSNTAVRVAEQLTDWAKETFGIVIIIGQVTKSGKIAGKQQIVHTIDVHAHMTIERDSDDQFFGCRLFGVIKNRFGPAYITYALDLTHRGFVERGQILSLKDDKDDKDDE